MLEPDATYVINSRMKTFHRFSMLGLVLAVTLSLGVVGETSANTPSRPRIKKDTVKKDTVKKPYVRKDSPKK